MESKCKKQILSQKTKTIMQSTLGGNNKSTLIEKQMKQLEKIKQKQVTFKNKFSKNKYNRPYSIK